MARPISQRRSVIWTRKSEEWLETGVDLLPFGQRLPQRFLGSSHLRHAGLVFLISRVEIGSSERAISPAVDAHEAPAAAAQAQGNRDAAAFSHG